MKGIKNDVPDLAEPLFDEALTSLAEEIFKTSLPSLVKELPLLKYGKTAGDVYGAYRLLKLRRRMEAFLQSLVDGQININEFHKLSHEEQDTITDIIVTELDNQTDNLQAEALGLLVVAYLSKKIDRLTFLGIAHELKNTNPLVFYFNADGFNVAPLKNEYQIFGPTHYLPVAFVTNSTEALQFSSQLYLSNLGKAFFKYIYDPMAGRHMV